MEKYCKVCGELLEECKCQKTEEQSKSEEQKEVNVGEVLKEIRQKIWQKYVPSPTESFERNKRIVPDCINPDEGEIPIRQYEIATLRSIFKGMYAEGRLQVTNKRVLFRAAGVSLMGSTELQHEFAIEELAGVEIRRDHRISPVNLILALILSSFVMNLASSLMAGINSVTNIMANILAILIVIGAIAGFFMTKGKFMMKLLGLAVAVGAVTEVGISTKYFILPEATNGFYSFLGVVVFILCILCLVLVAFVPNLVVDIKVKGASSPIEIRRKESNGILAFMFNMPKKDYTGFADVMPAKDTGKAIKELGALINDIHLMGDGAIEKWREE